MCENNKKMRIIMNDINDVNNINNINDMDKATMQQIEYNLKNMLRTKKTVEMMVEIKKDAGQFTNELQKQEKSYKRIYKTICDIDKEHIVRDMYEDDKPIKYICNRLGITRQTVWRKKREILQQIYNIFFC